MVARLTLKLVFNSSGVLAVSAAVPGEGGLAQLGTGTTTLSGAYAATGALVAEGGTLVFAATSWTRQTTASRRNCDAHLRLNPNDVTALCRRGLFRYLQKQDTRAAQDIAQASHLAPEIGTRLEALAAEARRQRYPDGS